MKTTGGERSEWRFGTRRVGDVLIVRDRWQGLFGANFWLTVLLVAGVFAAPGPWRLVCGAAIPVVACRFHPFVHFAPDTVRWRNRFRVKEIPTARITRLEITNYNPPTWVPVVSAELEGPGTWWRSANFVSTFSFREAAARVIAAEIETWAIENRIESDLPAHVMMWHVVPPSPSDRDDPASVSERWARGRWKLSVLVLSTVLGAIALVMTLLRDEERPDIPRFTAEDFPVLFGVPGGANAAAWGAVGQSAVQPVVFPAQWATGEVEVVDARTSATDWTYTLVWSENDGRSSSLRISSPPPTMSRLTPDQLAQDVVWSSGTTGDERALVLLDRSTCGEPSDEPPRSLHLVLTDRTGDVVGDITFAAGTGDPCQAPPHAVSSDELIGALRSLTICTTTGTGPTESTECAYLPINSVDIRAGAAVIAGD